MKRLYLSILFAFIVTGAFAQQISRDVNVVAVKTITNIPARSLEANFTCDVTTGVAPLTVHFTDQSTGNPTSWLWSFGDGGTDSVQNPIHTYTSNGIYTVKLTISDGIQIYALEKKDYITVTPNYTGCDTLHYPLPEPLTYYSLLKNNIPQGYVSGNNLFGDKAIADYFDNSSNDLAIRGAIFEFAYTKHSSLVNESLMVKAWAYDSIKQQPGEMLGSATIPFADIVQDVAAFQPTQVNFTEPLPVSGPFFLGIYLPENTGDTLVVWTTKTAAINPNSGWVLQSNNEWAPYDSLYKNPIELILTNAIYPIVCHTSNSVKEHTGGKVFSISPNPTSGLLRVESRLPEAKTARYELITATGEKIRSGSFNTLPGSELLDLGACKAGMYFLKIFTSSAIEVKRIIIK
ncbi:MAG TPA: PKD domain-containing protein [Bacteroidales bacterium]|nr:PKD domain-containing protein [Bacteroidales bacterium]